MIGVWIVRLSHTWGITKVGVAERSQRSAIRRRSRVQFSVPHLIMMRNNTLSRTPARPCPRADTHIHEQLVFFGCGLGYVGSRGGQGDGDRRGTWLLPLRPLPFSTATTAALSRTKQEPEEAPSSQRHNTYPRPVPPLNSSLMGRQTPSRGLPGRGLPGRGLPGSSLPTNLGWGGPTNAPSHSTTSGTPSSFPHHPDFSGNSRRPSQGASPGGPLPSSRAPHPNTASPHAQWGGGTWGWQGGTGKGAGKGWS